MSFLGHFMKIACKIADDKRDVGLETPVDIERYNDISYGEAQEHVLDVYYPAGKEKTVMPVIVNVHGGGWVYGDKERYQYYCMSLAQRGFKVVNFTYRLAPKHRHPAQLEDVCMVFKWIEDNGEKYGFDLTHVFGVGDSAGAHLLSLYCCLMNNQQLRRIYPFALPESMTVKAVALNCGTYDIKVGEKGLVNFLMKDLLGHNITEEESSKISPIHFINEYFPAAIVMTCSGDFLVAQAMPMVENGLKHYGVIFIYHGKGLRKQQEKSLKISERIQSATLLSELEKVIA